MHSPNHHNQADTARLIPSFEEIGRNELQYILQKYITKVPGRTPPNPNNPTYILNAVDTADLLHEDFQGRRYNDPRPLNESSRYRINTDTVRYKFAVHLGRNNEYNVQISYSIDEIDENLNIQKHRDELLTFHVRITNNDYKVMRVSFERKLAVVTISAMAVAIAYLLYNSLKR